MQKHFAFIAIPFDAPTAEPITFIILADTAYEAVDNFLHGHPRYIYTSYKEMPALSQEMIEGALDDVLDNMYVPYRCPVLDEEIPASEIIKTYCPDKYKSFIRDYCDHNHIIAELYSDGTWRYFEIPED